MEVAFVQKEAFTVIGFKDEVHENDSGQPKLWEKLGKDDYRLLTELADTPFGGVLHVVDKTLYNREDTANYYVAVATTQEKPSHLSQLDIPTQLWAVFEVKGEWPAALASTWEDIYTSWFLDSGYEPANSPEFLRIHAGGAKKEIWIPVLRISRNDSK